MPEMRKKCFEHPISARSPVGLLLARQRVIRSNSSQVVRPSVGFAARIGDILIWLAREGGLEGCCYASALPERVP